MRAEDTDMTLSIDRHIEISPDVCKGRPHIAGSRITVADVAIKHLTLGQPLDEIARKFDLSLAALHSAMAFYYDHRTEVDQRMADDEAYADLFKREHPHLVIDLSQK